MEKINEQIRKDVEFFKKYKLMDYSLLFAVERLPEAVVQSNAENKAYDSISGDIITNSSNLKAGGFKQHGDRK